MRFPYPIFRSLHVVIVLVVLSLSTTEISAQQSVARKWSECQLSCIRKDAARPTIQARNLLHASVVMYDAWAAFDDDASTFFLGKTWGNYTCPFQGIQIPDDRKAAQEKAISYAMYRFLTNRYQPFAPTPVGAPQNNWVTFMSGYVNNLMNSLGYDPSVTSTDYSDGDPAKLGNYIAAQMQLFAFQDGSNQQANYSNQYYETVNGNLFPHLPGNPLQVDGNRWQPLSLQLALDQNGLPISNGAPALSAEWGNVVPFALREDQMVTYERDGHDWNVYLDPGPPPLLDTLQQTGLNDDFFKWGYSVVSFWHSLHDPSDGVMKDISPNSIGNIDVNNLPTTFEEYKDFYNEFEGGDIGTGYTLNPVTGQPYPTQIIPRGDYTRVLAEYWADGPNSETPPGHWFKIINQIADHPLFEKRWEGQGPILDDLEWDVRAYFALGGGIHDAAVACWSAKGYYDYTRPIMAIRYMIDRGQCTDENLPNYHPGGLPLVPGYFELVEIGDPLAGPNNENVGKIKVNTWRGPSTATGQDGVGWILGENWWTFQRATFVTPPFPGYYSGHSTYSRTAAEILSELTGSEYFPGGVGEFHAAQNQYLGATTGPSVDITLQWARYADAADQCSLSRIYGGLHPPCDDIPGRKVGLVVGPQAYELANSIINAGIPHVLSIIPSKSVITDADAGTPLTVEITFSEPMNTAVEPSISFPFDDPQGSLIFNSGVWTDNTHYLLSYTIADNNTELNKVVLRVSGAEDLTSQSLNPGLDKILEIDTQNPVVEDAQPIVTVINDDVAETGTFSVELTFSEEMATASPELEFTSDDPSTTISFNAGLSSWSNPYTFVAVFDVTDAGDELSSIDLNVTASDAAGNASQGTSFENLFTIDTRNPVVATQSLSATTLLDSNAGLDSFSIIIEFDETMNTAVSPAIEFPEGGVAEAGLTFNALASQWINPTSYEAHFDLSDLNAELSQIDLRIASAEDAAGNGQQNALSEDALSIDTYSPSVSSVELSTSVITEEETGSSFTVTVQFDDEMDMEAAPVIEIGNGDLIGSTLVPDAENSGWSSAFIYVAAYDVADENEELDNTDVSVVSANDASGNPLSSDYTEEGALDVDTRNPLISMALANAYNIGNAQIGNGGFEITVIFDEPMNTASIPVISFPAENPSAVLTFNAGLSQWINPTSYVFSFDVSDDFISIDDIDIRVSGAEDVAGNNLNTEDFTDFFDIHSTVGVQEMGDALSAIRLYPNPVKSGDLLNLAIPQMPEGLVIRIVDMKGALVEQITPNTWDNNIRISTSTWSAGTYFVQLTSKEGTRDFKLSLTH